MTAPIGFSFDTEGAAEEIERITNQMMKLDQQLSIGVINTREYEMNIRGFKAELAGLAQEAHAAGAAPEGLARGLNMADSSLRSVEAGAFRAERSLQRVEFGMYSLMNASRGGAMGLRGISLGLSRLVMGMGAPELMIAVAGASALYESVSHIVSANKEAEKAANDAAEAQRKMIDEARKPVVERHESEQEHIRHAANKAAMEARSEAVDRVRASELQAQVVGRAWTSGLEAQIAVLLESADKHHALATALADAANEAARNAAANKAMAQYEANEAHLKSLRDEVALMNLSGDSLKLEIGRAHV